MNPEEQNNQDNQPSWNKNKTLLAVGVMIIAFAGLYFILKKDSGAGDANTDKGLKYEAVPAEVLNVDANTLWVSFPASGGEKGEFKVSETTSIVRLDFTSAGPRETKIGLVELRQGDNLLIYYNVKGGKLELNRVEFLNFPPPPAGTVVPTELPPPAF